MAEYLDLHSVVKLDIQMVGETAESSVEPKVEMMVDGLADSLVIVTVERMVMLTDFGKAAWSAALKVDEKAGEWE